MKMREKAGLLAIIGGILMMIAGVTGAATWQSIGDMATEITGVESLGIIFQILVILGAFGGLLVLIGGLLLLWNTSLIRTEKRVNIGKILISIGAGFGTISLFIFILLTALSENPLGNLIGALGIGFVGLLLTIAARVRA